ncbi:MAG: leucine-rich repeat domain-containing protein, partial [Thermoguttaceae bacterium]|nr:leucine-rich repeat domain-containing protein [Thermoguttaceae bacterium]
DLPSALNKIGSEAFAGTAITTIPDLSNVKTLGSGVFSYCTQLQSVNYTLNNVYDDMFNGCSSLELVKLPDSVTEIGDDAFRDCPKLTLRVPKGSYAERFAIEMGIKYETF